MFNAISNNKATVELEQEQEGMEQQEGQGEVEGVGTEEEGAVFAVYILNFLLKPVYDFAFNWWTILG